MPDFFALFLLFPKCFQILPKSPSLLPVFFFSYQQPTSQCLSILDLGCELEPLTKEFTTPGDAMLASTRDLVHPLSPSQLPRTERASISV